MHWLGKLDNTMTLKLQLFKIRNRYN